LVLDEADMVTDSFLENIINLWAPLEGAKKMFFSATFKDESLASMKRLISNVIYIEPKEENVKSLKIDHYLIPSKRDDDLKVLKSLINIINPYLCIIFANKKEEVDMLYKELKEDGLNVISLHGDLSLRERKRIVNEINALKYQYVVASDMLSRGIDIIGVSHIINYNLPKDFEFYIHRSGRTGRMDMDGVCYSLYNDENETYLQNLEKRGIKFQYVNIKNGEIVEIKDRGRKQASSEEMKKASKMLGTKKEVKPGYKKKYNEEKKKIAKKMKGRR